MGLRKRAIGTVEPFGRAWCAASSRGFLRIVLLAGLSASVFAQESAESTVPQRAWLIVPSVSLQETFSDNVSLVAGNRRSDWITDIAPGVRIDGRTAHVKMNLDYRLHELVYAQGGRGHQTQQSLSSLGTIEAIDKFLFVDMSGTISQQRISAFGNQSASSYSINDNSTETSTYRLSPYVKGRFGGYADYEGRYSRTSVRSKSSAASGVDSQVWSGRLSGDTPLAALGWAVDADRQEADYEFGQKNHSEHWRGFGNYRVNSELKLSVSAGQERNNYLSANTTSYNTHGFGFDWRPTERTDVSMFKEKRFFGDGHTVTINHRMPQSSVKYTDSRDVSVTPTQSGRVGLGTVYDLYLALRTLLFPNETQAEHEDAVRTKLAETNTPANAIFTAGYLSSQATLQRRQELSYVLRGARNVLALSLVRSRDESLGTAMLVGFGGSSTTTSISQQGVNISWSHELSALSSLGVNATHSSSTSGTDLNLQTTQKSLSASFSTRLGAKTQGAVTARRTVFSSPTSPYTENAVSGSVSVEF
jgi:uncharacterized protein (PEP-CTERM system associated)